MPAIADADEPRIDQLLARWDELRRSGMDPRPSELTDDPNLLPALTRAIAEVESAEEGLGLGPTALAAMPTGVPGRYEVFGVPLQGGMGEVYRARDLEIEGRVVAYKVMRAEGEPTPAAVTQFYREARITDQVRQPGVVPIYAQLEDGSGRPAYAMEFVEGETLGAARKGFEASPADAERCVEVLRRFLDACRIVGVAHAKGVVHGDLNSRNILLIEGRRATRVVDWGSAIEVGTEDEARPSHAVAPDYRDPALGAGDPPNYGSDVHALGVGLGKLARSVEVGGIAILEGRKRASALRALRAIAQTASASRPDERYPGAEALAADLERFLAGQRVHADRGEPLSERAWRWASRHRAAVTSAFGAATLGVVALAVITQAAREARRSRQIALSSRYGEIGAVCKLLGEEGQLDAQDDSDQIRVLRGLIVEKGRDSADLAQALQFLEEDSARQAANRLQAARAHRAEIEDRLNTGVRVLGSLIEEFPEREGSYRLLLAKGYIDLAKLKVNGRLDARGIAAIVGEILSGKPRGPGRADFESALALNAKALSLLPPLRPDSPADDPVRRARQDIHISRMVDLLGLGRCTEALQSLDEYLGALNEANPSMALVRPSLLKVAETEQQRMPWSSPPAVDHAKAVRMAEYLADQEGVSDAAIFNAACACSLASVDTAAGAGERERRSARAAGYLRRIADRGYFHGLRFYPPPVTDTLKELETDYALDPLRDRPDFRALIARFSGRSKTGGGR